MISRDRQEAKQRTVERREREDKAPRLNVEVRRLVSLDIEIEHAESRYIWRIVVDRAPALFELACPEQTCTNGGHDITRPVMQGLKSSQTAFEGESTCRGDLPSGNCGRVVKYRAKATYKT